MNVAQGSCPLTEMGAVNGVGWVICYSSNVKHSNSSLQCEKPLTESTPFPCNIREEDPGSGCTSNLCVYGCCERSFPPSGLVPVTRHPF